MPGTTALSRTVCRGCERLVQRSRCPRRFTTLACRHRAGPDLIVRQDRGSGADGAHSGTESPLRGRVHSTQAHRNEPLSGGPALQIDLDADLHDLIVRKPEVCGHRLRVALQGSKYALHGGRHQASGPAHDRLASEHVDHRIEIEGTLVPIDDEGQPPRGCSACPRNRSEQRHGGDLALVRRASALGRSDEWHVLELHGQQHHLADDETPHALVAVGARRPLYGARG